MAAFQTILDMLEGQNRGIRVKWKEIKVSLDKKEEYS